MTGPWERAAGRDGYTELFFLDEVTALAAGHRPCFECRRADAKRFAARWAQAKGIAAPHAPDMDMTLQSERLDGRVKRTHDLPSDDLPDATALMLPDRPGMAFALRGSSLLRWSAEGYVEKIARARGIAKVLTPPSIIGVLRAGYAPLWHPTAEAL
jgi:hypothetical protein